MRFKSKGMVSPKFSNFNWPEYWVDWKWGLYTRGLSDVYSYKNGALCQNNYLRILPGEGSRLSFKLFSSLEEGKKYEFLTFSQLCALTMNWMVRCGNFLHWVPFRDISYTSWKILLFAKFNSGLAPGANSRGVGGCWIQYLSNLTLNLPTEVEFDAKTKRTMISWKILTSFEFQV